jgi:hypothetical protein
MPKSMETGQPKGILFLHKPRKLYVNGGRKKKDCKNQTKTNTFHMHVAKWLQLEEEGGGGEGGEGGEEGGEVTKWLTDHRNNGISMSRNLKQGVGSHTQHH